MGFEDIREFDSETSRGKLRFRVMDLENGLLVLITESENFKLGISAVAIPPGQGRDEPTSSGLFSMGFDNTAVRTLAERVAAWTNKTCMMVVHMKNLERGALVEILSILKNNFLT